jgi:tetratricopeptide (TPR) repeat protein
VIVPLEFLRVISPKKANRFSLSLPRNRRGGGLLLLAVAFFGALNLAATTVDQPNFSAIETLIKQSKLELAETQLQSILQKQPTNYQAEDLLGQVRLRQEKYDEAEALFRRAVQHNPKSEEACVGRASLLRDERRTEEAISQYETCQKLAPQRTSNATELAKLYQQAGEYEKSLRVESAIPPVARSTKLLPVLAVDYLALGKPEPAHKAIGDVLAHASADPEIVPELAIAFVQHGMVNDAAELLKIAQSQQKTTPAFLAAVARVQAAEGDQQQARATAMKALQMDPKSIEALSTAAALAEMANDWDAAAGFLDRALSAGAPRDDLLQQVVYVEIKKHDLVAAHEIAQRWHKLRPNDPVSTMALATVMIEANHFGEAKPLLEKFLASAPNDKRAQLEMGLADYNTGNLPEASHYLTSSLGQGPEDSTARYYLGLIAKQQGDIESAVDQMNRALAVNPDNPRALGALGQLYLQQNELEKARSLLEKAVEKVPEEPQNHYELARVYNKLGMKDEAQQQLQLYEKLRNKRPTEASPSQTVPPQ